MPRERIAAVRGTSMIRINRDVGEGTFALSTVFDGIDRSPAVLKIFGGNGAAKEACAATNVTVVDSMAYMWVNDENGHLMVSLEYLRHGDDRTLYLDAVHELVHVKQFREGRELFDDRYRYVDRPTEIEAYKITVEEARRIGMSDREIAEYLRVDWVSGDELRRLAHRLGVRIKGAET